MGKTMDPRLFLKLAPERRLIMTFALRQALEILQMPQLDLGQWLLSEIERNPLLELGPVQTKKRFEGELPATINLNEHLMNQVRENFSDDKDRLIAEEFLEHLDEKGFLSCSLETISSYFKKPVDRILTVLQTFDPPGIFARNLQEALLLQLRAKGKAESLAFNLVQNCFDDLLHGRYGAIKKKLGSTDLNLAMSDLARLSLRPSHAFKIDPVAPIYPDLQIHKIEGGWALELIEDDLPQFRIQTEYLDIETESEEEKESLRTFKTQAKWIFRSLNRRRKLLREIGRILIRKQSAFLDQKGPLAQLTMKELAEKLCIHESTLSRALSGKYATTPRGIIPLRSLISADPEAANARMMLEKLIRAEDKTKPFTDDQLVQELGGKGFKVARRTVAKYRTQLKIGSASQRKHNT
jgi:RNA polymerase sigma-54 factor